MSANPPNGTPGAAEFGMLRAYLAQHGMSQAQIRQAIGTGAQGRTRAQIAAELAAFCATLTKTTKARQRDG